VLVTSEGLGLPWREGASLTEGLDEVELDFVIECDQRWDRQRASKYLKAAEDDGRNSQSFAPSLKFLGRGAKPVQGGEEERWLVRTHFSRVHKPCPNIGHLY
jgi:hypothetical protein